MDDAPLIDEGTGTKSDQPPEVPLEVPLWRRVLAVACICGIPIAWTGTTEVGQWMETSLEGGPYRKGYLIGWLNHSVLVIFLIPWALSVLRDPVPASERPAPTHLRLWRAMKRPYGSGRRLLGVTFWLAAQYM